jgi:E3 ubiquitin-protein ligase EDD1
MQTHSKSNNSMETTLPQVNDATRTGDNPFWPLPPPLIPVSATLPPSLSPATSSAADLPAHTDQNSVEIGLTQLSSSFSTKNEKQASNEQQQATKACNCISSENVELFSEVKLSEKEKRENALEIIFILLQSSALRPHLYELLSHKNSEGATPFMYAVSVRAYDAAHAIYEHIVTTMKNINHQQQTISSYTRDLQLTNMLFPLNSRIDQSPLYTLCSNDTCSFTWTGDQHITQDIFECRTCTLVGNLCCCTECARTCHKGHDCKIKTSSSPTAYCDCWEKCKCKSLIAGDQQKRFLLFDTLVSQTNLLSISNWRSEHLMIYLVNTFARQIQEQKNFKRVSGN